MTGTKYRERVLASMLVGVLALSVSVPRVNGADAELPNARSVPRAQAIPLPHEQVSLQADGVELTRLHFGADDLRPFNYPVNGPTGRSLTRMGHPHDPVGHSHHNSIWISHHDVNGVSFWADQGQGRIVVQRVEELGDGEAEAFVLTTGEWRAADGKVLLRERRRTGIRLLPAGEWWLLLDLEFAAPDTNIVTFGKTPFGLVGVRMAKTIGVNDGGGMSRNSEGGVNEKGVFWKPARWLDYSGPIVSGRNEGITLLDHPANPNHPTVFHVRDDGWMGAALTFDASREVRAGQPLRLRYGFWIHSGVPEAKRIEEQWRAFAATSPPQLEKAVR